MRRTVLLLVVAVGLAVLPGCHFDFWGSVLGSLYGAYGEGYSGDRMSDFDQRYEQQSKAASEYYRERE